MKRSGSKAPNPEARLIVSMIEGTTLFIGQRQALHGRMFHDAVFDSIREFAKGKYNIKREYKASLAIVAYRENPLLVLINLSQRQEYRSKSSIKSHITLHVI